jgi:DNA-binding GntR family transcriptional regulator
MRRLLGMYESAWNITEPLQPMAKVTEADRAALHSDHGELLAAFLARDTAALLRSARAHHRRLRSALHAEHPLPAASDGTARDGAGTDGAGADGAAHDGTARDGVAGPG